MSNYSNRSYNHRRRLSPVGITVLILCVICVAAVTFFVLLRQGAFPGLTTAKHSASSAQVSKKAAASSASNSGSSLLAAISKDDAKYAAEQAILPSEVSLQNAVKPYHIEVSIDNQNVTIYDTNNKVIESFICSTGSSGTDTPKGTFSVYNRGKSFFNKDVQEGAYYWVAFYKDYYFHSVPYDKNQKIIQSIADDLGTKDSHGCVHLTIPDSKWVYDDIPNGTKVVVD
jgi:lipoprotein-anchoring transpeptidase ErfK/SrfK